MSTHLVQLFTHPDDAWMEIRQEEELHPRHYLPHLLLMALIPALCLFIGTTSIGWSLAGTERVRLSVASAAELGVLLYAACVVGVMIMGGFIRWMSRTFDARPSLNQCIGFAAYTATPYFVAGVAGLYPGRWLALIVLGAASAYATFLLYVGLPTFLRLRKEDGLLYSTSVWAVGLLVLVTILVSMILFWFNVLSPEYLRPASLG
ncbi:Yip1 family protein [Pseudomonas sp. NPDC087612]|uniref:Yip1 family protein n=1 Tax=unclassified Pseudomonas TaxID=196821 RepID=UPI0005EBC918|nr:MULTISPECIES: Yip1 family protein [unclassified Pseudomonas]KJK18091.1 membrane protein [Pseudomonas sp. 2(2015)]QVM94608.1 YIP1 family protein [Pseudomonas sp. SORT22]UVM58169.1 YIP1 family protein [Pseudomonas sp. B21-012]